MEKADKIINLLNSEDKTLVYLILASLISADNNMTKEEITHNLEILKYIDSKRASIQTDDNAKLFNYIKDGIEILTKELNEICD